MFTPNKPDTTVLYSGESLKDAVDTMSSDMYHKTTVLPPLHAQMQFPDLNLEEVKAKPVPAVTKIVMSPMKIYILVSMFHSANVSSIYMQSKDAYAELVDMGMIKYDNLTLKGMDYIKKLQEVQP